MAKAIWNGVMIAESDDIALVEGNAYFPAESVAWDHLRKSGETAPTYCHWKGFASYYDIVVDGAENKGAVWTYEEPYQEAETIKNTHIAEHLSLPPVKIHCSVLAEDAIKAAISDYRAKNRVKGAIAAE